ncbi:MAG TPA: hypothetical protein QGG93_04450, partial [Verrucomicrobiota bacterium]|nr:hypothetical protein [Verrucomicrobiota bacterium]
MSKRHANNRVIRDAPRTSGSVTYRCFFGKVADAQMDDLICRGFLRPGTTLVFTAAAWMAQAAEIQFNRDIRS